MNIVSKLASLAILAGIVTLPSASSAASISTIESLLNGNSGVSLDAGYGGRQGAFTVGLQYDAFRDIAGIKGFDVGAKVFGSSEGKQPHEIKNVNNVVGINAVISSPKVFGVSGFIEGGAITSRYGYNGAGNGYKNNTGLTGYDVGGGITIPVTRNFAVFSEVNDRHYQQVDKTAYVDFLAYSVGFKVSF